MERSRHRVGHGEWRRMAHRCRSVERRRLLLLLDVGRRRGDAEAEERLAGIHGPSDGRPRRGRSKRHGAGATTNSGDTGPTASESRSGGDGARDDQLATTGGGPNTQSDQDTSFVKDECCGAVGQTEKAAAVPAVRDRVEAAGRCDSSLQCPITTTLEATKVDSLPRPNYRRLHQLRALSLHPHLLPHHRRSLAHYFTNFPFLFFLSLFSWSSASPRHQTTRARALHHAYRLLNATNNAPNTYICSPRDSSFSSSICRPESVRTVGAASMSTTWPSLQRVRCSYRRN